MPHSHRKLAYSGKKKKNQILQKRQLKNNCKSETTEDSEMEFDSAKPIEQSCVNNGHNRNTNRYNLHFFKESTRELEILKIEGLNPIKKVFAKDREIDASCFDGYDFPTRPIWRYDMGKNALERNENLYFQEYVDQLKKYHKLKKKDLPIFELNLETWRQLWRVLEMSDILLIVVDVRYAPLQFPPSLYKYILETLKRQVILVLNKVDLIAPHVVVAWRQYFHETYSELPIVLFASYPTKAPKGMARNPSWHKRCMEGVHKIFIECQKISQSEVNLSSWEQKILEDFNTENLECEEELSSFDHSMADISSHPPDRNHQMYRNGILTLGCVGFPNVGKSSIINALKGKKVVSVSRTPGHTKHFQTIYLTNVICLVDCPGLVFPSAIPKHLQVLLGSYPISQLQVPYRALRFLSEHLNLPHILKVSKPEDYDEWSPVAVADAWALKRGFLTAKAARPDRNRAANHLLRLCLAGQIILQFYPPAFYEQEMKWLQNEEIEEVKRYQNLGSDDNKIIPSDDVSSLIFQSIDSDYATSSNSDSNTDKEDQLSKSFNAFALLEEE